MKKIFSRVAVGVLIAVILGFLRFFGEKFVESFPYIFG